MTTDTHSSFSLPTYDLSGLDWAITSQYERTGMRSTGQQLEHRIETDATPQTYRSDSCAVLGDLAAATNAAGDALIGAMRKAGESAGWMLPEVRTENARAVFEAELAHGADRLRSADRRLDELSAKVNRDARPERPANVSDAAEATLKTDLRMRLDHVDVDIAVDRLQVMLADASANGDDATLWTLALSDWAAWYLEARGVDPFQFAAFEAARAVYLPPAVVAAREFAASALDELRGFAAACRQTHMSGEQQLRATFDEWVRGNVQTPQ